jgi:hypothetical protein
MMTRSLGKVRGCLVPLFSQKNLGFGPSFSKMELNTMQIFLAKRWLFSILDFGLKRPKKPKMILKSLS